MLSTADIAIRYHVWAVREKESRCVYGTTKKSDASRRWWSPLRFRTRRDAAQASVDVIGSKARGVIRLSMNVRRLRRVPVLQPAQHRRTHPPPILPYSPPLRPTCSFLSVALHYLIAVYRPGVRERGMKADGAISHDLFPHKRTIMKSERSVDGQKHLARFFQLFN